MVTKAKTKPDDPEQFARFMEAAKEAEVDETGDAFERAFKKVVPEKRAPRLGPTRREPAQRRDPVGS